MLPMHSVTLQVLFICQKEILISADFVEYTGVSCGIWYLKAMHRDYLLTITTQGYLKQS